MSGFTAKGQTWLVGSLLALLTLALYWPARHFEFVDLDDPGYVFENQTVRQGVSGSGLMWALADAHEANWHPVTWVSHMLDCQCFGLRAGAHHLMNVGLHCANTVLLFLLLRAMTGAFWRCAFVAAAFAWHPLRVESVAWISERKDVLSAFFFLLTLWAYVRYADDEKQKAERRRQKGEPQDAKASAFPPAAPRQRGKHALPHYALALICFALGLMSKPMLVTTPFVMLLLDFWPLGRFAADKPKSKTVAASTIVFRLFLEKIPFFALSILASVVTVASQRAGGALVSLKSAGLAERLTRALMGGLGYLEKFFWPQDLAVFYLPQHPVPAALLALALAVLVGVSAGVLMNLRRRPYLAVGWFWFTGMLAPVCGLVQVGPQYMADRYTYLPGIGLLLMLAWGGAEFLGRVASPRTRASLALGVAMPLLLASFLISSHQLGYWQNTRVLMDHALEVDPSNYIAHNLLGAYYTRIGQPQQAALHHRRAQELWPP